MSARQIQRLVALFAFGAVLLNYPILAIARGDAVVLGIPAPYVYLFAVWGLLILLMALVVERTR